MKNQKYYKRIWTFETSCQSAECTVCILKKEIFTATIRELHISTDHLKKLIHTENSI